MKIKSIAQGEEYLYQFFPKTNLQKFQGDWGLARVKYFLKQLGDPQNKIKVIHIAGTSGKGSTSFILSYVLCVLGFRVGLHLSPPLLDIRERFEIDNEFISEEEFVTYLNNLIPRIEEMKNTEFGTPTFFEILISLAFVIFYERQVDYAVIETAMGGMLDATNAATAENKMAVITKIGFDHTQILGSTLPEIAYQKAMIMHNKNLALSVWQEKEAEDVIRNVAKKQHAQLTILDSQTFRNVRSYPDKTIFDFQFDEQRFDNLELSLAGLYQVENASAALAALILLSKRDMFQISEKKIRSAMQNLFFPARMEVRSIGNKTIIIDGAHNPQKMSAFIESLKNMFPSKKFHFLLAFKKDKNFPEMLLELIPLAEKITITSFVKKADLLIQSVDPKEIAKELERLVFRSYSIIHDPHEAVESVFGSPSKDIVITGSLYFISEIYKDFKKLRN